MKKLLVPLCVSAGLTLASGAMAADNTMNQGVNQPKNQTGQSQQQSQNQQTQEQQRLAMTQAKLRKTLQQAGFKNIRVVDANYLVQAQTEDGDNVLMFINPPQTNASNAQNTSEKSASNNNNNDKTNSE